MDGEHLPKKRFPRGIMGTCCVPWLADHTLDEQIFAR